MSDEPGDRSGEGGQGGGNGPAGGGQPAGGPPQGAGAPQGQPAGGYQRGPGVGDIFSMPETMDEIKLGVGLYTAIGLGVAVAAILMSLLQGVGGAVIGGILLIGSMALGPGIGAILALRQDEELEDQPDNIVYANAGATTAIGTIVLGIIGGIGVTVGGQLASPGMGGGGMGGGMSVGTSGIGNLILPLILIGISAAVTAVFTIWLVRSLLAPNPVPAGQGAPQHGAP